jgi:hypothetical protein
MRRRSRRGGGCNPESVGGRWRRAEAEPDLGLVWPERVAAPACDGDADHVSDVAVVVVSRANTGVLRAHFG